MKQKTSIEISEWLYKDGLYNTWWLRLERGHCSEISSNLKTLKNNNVLSIIVFVDSFWQSCFNGCKPSPGWAARSGVSDSEYLSRLCPILALLLPPQWVLLIGWSLTHPLEQLLWCLPCLMGRTPLIHFSGFALEFLLDLELWLEGYNVSEN